MVEKKQKNSTSWYTELNDIHICIHKKNSYWNTTTVTHLHLAMAAFAGREKSQIAVTETQNLTIYHLDLSWEKFADPARENTR